MRTPLIYSLFGTHLFGTERMALATAEGLADDFDPVIFGCCDPVVEEAQRRGMQTRRYSGLKDFSAQLWPFFRQHERLAFISTSISHSIACIAMNVLWRRKVAHLLMVHGSEDTRAAYGRKYWLNPAPLQFVAVSPYAKRVLIDHRVRPDKISVVGNFLTDGQIASAPRRPPFAETGIQRVVMIGRVNPAKRTQHLLDALDRNPRLRGLSVRIIGLGNNIDELRARAAKNNPNVTFVGFSAQVAEEMANADLLVHLCPVESFGLVVLEAMAADLPVLAVDQGGVADLVDDEVTGFKLRTDDVEHLSARLEELMSAPAERLNRVVRGARQILQSRFAASAPLSQYRALLADVAPQQPA